MDGNALTTAAFSSIGATCSGTKNESMYITDYVANANGAGVLLLREFSNNTVRTVARFQKVTNGLGIACAVDDWGNVYVGYTSATGSFDISGSVAILYYAVSNVSTTGAVSSVPIDTSSHPGVHNDVQVSNGVLYVLCVSISGPTSGSYSGYSRMFEYDVSTGDPVSSPVDFESSAPVIHFAFDLNGNMFIVDNSYSITSVPIVDDVPVWGNPTLVRAGTGNTSEIAAIFFDISNTLWAVLNEDSYDAVARLESDNTFTMVRKVPNVVYYERWAGPDTDTPMDHMNYGVRASVHGNRIYMSFNNTLYQLFLGGTPPAPAPTTPPYPPPTPPASQYSMVGVAQVASLADCGASTCSSLVPIQGDAEGRLVRATTVDDAAWGLHGVGGSTTISILDFYFNTLSSSWTGLAVLATTTKTPRYINVTTVKGAKVTLAIGIHQPRGAIGGVEIGLVPTPSPESTSFMRTFFKLYLGLSVAVASLLLCVVTRIASK